MAKIVSGGGVTPIEKEKKKKKKKPIPTFVSKEGRGGVKPQSVNWTTPQTPRSEVPTILSKNIGPMSEAFMDKNRGVPPTSQQAYDLLHGTNGKVLDYSDWESVYGVTLPGVLDPTTSDIQRFATYYFNRFRAWPDAEKMRAFIQSYKALGPVRDFGVDDIDGLMPPMPGRPGKGDKRVEQAAADSTPDPKNNRKWGWTEKDLESIGGEAKADATRRMANTTIHGDRMDQKEIFDIMQARGWYLGTDFKNYIIQRQEERKAEGAKKAVAGAELPDVSIGVLGKNASRFEKDRKNLFMKAPTKLSDSDKDVLYTYAKLIQEVYPNFLKRYKGEIVWDKAFNNKMVEALFLSSISYALSDPEQVGQETVDNAQKVIEVATYGAVKADGDLRKQLSGMGIRGGQDVISEFKFDTWTSVYAKNMEPHAAVMAYTSVFGSEDLPQVQRQVYNDLKDKLVPDHIWNAADFSTPISREGAFASMFNTLVAESILPPLTKEERKQRLIDERKRMEEELTSKKDFLVHGPVSFTGGRFAPKPATVTIPTPVSEITAKYLYTVAAPKLEWAGHKIDQGFYALLVRFPIMMQLLMTRMVTPGARFAVNEEGKVVVEESATRLEKASADVTKILMSLPARALVHQFEPTIFNPQKLADTWSIKGMETMSVEDIESAKEWRWLDNLNDAWRNTGYIAPDDERILKNSAWENTYLKMMFANSDLDPDEHKHIIHAISIGTYAGINILGDKGINLAARGAVRGTAAAARVTPKAVSRATSITAAKEAVVAAEAAEHAVAAKKLPDIMHQMKSLSADLSAARAAGDTHMAGVIERKLEAIGRGDFVFPMTDEIMEGPLGQAMREHRRARQALAELATPRWYDHIDYALSLHTYRPYQVDTILGVNKARYAGTAIEKEIAEAVRTIAKSIDPVEISQARSKLFSLGIKGNPGDIMLLKARKLADACNPSSTVLYWAKNIPDGVTVPNGTRRIEEYIQTVGHATKAGLDDSEAAAKVINRYLDKLWNIEGGTEAVINVKRQAVWDEFVEFIRGNLEKAAATEAEKNDLWRLAKANHLTSGMSKYTFFQKIGSQWDLFEVYTKIVNHKAWSHRLLALKRFGRSKAVKLTSEEAVTRFEQQAKKMGEIVGSARFYDEFEPEVPFLMPNPKTQAGGQLSRNLHVGINVRDLVGFTQGRKARLFNTAINTNIAGFLPSFYGAARAHQLIATGRMWFVLTALGVDEIHRFPILLLGNKIGINPARWRKLRKLIKSEGLVDDSTEAMWQNLMRSRSGMHPIDQANPDYLLYLNDYIPFLKNSAFGDDFAEFLMSHPDLSPAELKASFKEHMRNVILGDSLEGSNMRLNLAQTGRGTEGRGLLTSYISPEELAAKQRQWDEGLKLLDSKANEILEDMKALREQRELLKETHNFSASAEPNASSIRTYLSGTHLPAEVRIYSAIVMKASTAGEVKAAYRQMLGNLDKATAARIERDIAEHHRLRSIALRETTKPPRPSRAQQAQLTRTRVNELADRYFREQATEINSRVVKRLGDSEATRLTNKMKHGGSLSHEERAIAEFFDVDHRSYRPESTPSRVIEDGKSVPNKELPARARELADKLKSIENPQMVKTWTEARAVAKARAMNRTLNSYVRKYKKLLSNENEKAKRLARAAAKDQVAHEAKLARARALDVHVDVSNSPGVRFYREYKRLGRELDDAAENFELARIQMDEYVSRPRPTFGLDRAAEAWLEEMSMKFDLIIAHQELRQAYMSGKPLTRKQFEELAARCVSNDTPLPLVVGADSGAIYGPGYLPGLSEWAEGGLDAVPLIGRVTKKMGRMPGVLGKVSHALTSTGPYTLLDMGSNWTRRMAYAGNLMKEYDTLVKLGVNQKEALRIAHAKALKFADDVMYTSGQTAFEATYGKGIMMFMPAYRQAAMFWGKAFLKHPLLMSRSREIFGNEALTAGLGPYSAFLPTPFWMGKSDSLLGELLPGVNMPILMPLRILNAYSGFNKNKETGEYTYSGATKLDFLAKIPMLSFSDKGVSPLSTLDDLMFGIFGDSYNNALLGTKHAPLVALYGIGIALRTDPEKRKKLAVNIMQAQTAAGHKPDLDAAMSELMGSPWWYAFMKTAFNIEQPEAILSAATRTLAPSRIGYRPADLKEGGLDFFIRGGADKSIWSEIMDDNEIRSMADADYAMIQARGNKEKEQEILDKYPKYKAVYEFRNLRDFEKEEYLLKPENQWIIPYVTGKWDYSESGVMLSNWDYYKGRRDGINIRRGIQTVRDEIGNLYAITDWTEKLNDIDEKFEKRLKSAQKRLIQWAKEEARAGGESTKKRYMRDALSYIDEYFDKTADSETEEAMVEVPTWMSRAAKRHGLDPNNPEDRLKWDIAFIVTAQRGALKSVHDENTVYRASDVYTHQRDINAGIEVEGTKPNYPFGDKTKTKITGLMGHYARADVYKPNELKRMLRTLDALEKVTPGPWKHLFSRENSISYGAISKELAAQNEIRENKIIKLATDEHYYAKSPASRFESIGIYIANHERFDDLYEKRQLLHDKYVDDTKNITPNTKEYNKINAAYKAAIDKIDSDPVMAPIRGGIAGRLRSTFIAKPDKMDKKFIGEAVTDLMKVKNVTDVEQIVNRYRFANGSPNPKSDEAAHFWNIFLGTAMVWRAKLRKYPNKYTGSKGISPDAKTAPPGMKNLNMIANVLRKRSDVFRRRYDKMNRSEKLIYDMLYYEH